MSADDALREAIDRVLERKPPQRRVVPAHIYDRIKALGWDTRDYVRAADVKVRREG